MILRSCVRFVYDSQAMERMKVVFSHLNTVEKTALRANSTGGVQSFTNKPDDIVIVSALRTPICKANRGAFKDTYADHLLSAAFSGVLRDSGISPRDIGDISVGIVSEPMPSLIARTAQFYSGIPEDVPLFTTNRQCSSGLQAFMNVVGSIKTGVTNIGLAGGVESMSKNAMGARGDFNPRVFEMEKTQDLLIPMGITSENVAEKFGITREDQDRFALDSQRKAAAAADSGLFNNEITPVKTVIKDKDGNETEITVTKDDGIRPTTIEGLRKLKPAFKEGGSTTAGNASQRSDGAAAVLVCTRQEAERRGWQILGIWRAYAVVGCPPAIMGIGPAVAIPEVLKKAGLTVSDIDIFEINEAFASQAKYCVDKLGIPPEKVNPKGGAIALGHPLGCTGARQIATLLHELKRRKRRSLGVVSMCMGTGMGAAAVFEFPGQ